MKARMIDFIFAAVLLTGCGRQIAKPTPGSAGETEPPVATTSAGEPAEHPAVSEEPILDIGIGELPSLLSDTVFLEEHAFNELSVTALESCTIRFYGGSPKFSSSTGEIINWDYGELLDERKAEAGVTYHYGLTIPENLPNLLLAAETADWTVYWVVQNPGGGYEDIPEFSIGPADDRFDARVYVNGVKREE